MNKREEMELRSLGLTDYYFQKRQEAIEAVEEMMKHPLSTEEFLKQIREHSKKNW